MEWELRKEQLREEKDTYANRLDMLYKQLYDAGPGEGESLREEMARLDRRIFAIDYLYLIHEYPGLNLTADTRDFLDSLAVFAKEKPSGTIRIKDYVHKDFTGIKELVNEAREKHVLEMRMEANTEYTGYILRNDYANKHQVVAGDRDELKEIMRSPV
jgi:hypothetical protein